MGNGLPWKLTLVPVWRRNQWTKLVSGLPLAAEHAVLGCLLCVTIIGIPFGLQQFKLAKLALMVLSAQPWKYFI